MIQKPTYTSESDPFSQFVIRRNGTVQYSAPEAVQRDLRIQALQYAGMECIRATGRAVKATAAGALAVCVAFGELGSPQVAVDTVQGRNQLGQFN